MQHLAFRPSLRDRLTIRHFRRNLEADQRPAFDDALESVMGLEEPYLSDKTTQGHILFAASVLCTYRVMTSAGTPVPQARAALGDMLARLGRHSMAVIMWLTVRLSRDPFAAVRYYTKEKTTSAYGPSFDIRFEEVEGGFVSEVRRCGYRSFLQRHDALELNELICAWDAVWIDRLPETILFDRPTTLARGCASCRFEFRRG